MSDEKDYEPGLEALPQLANANRIWTAVYLAGEGIDRSLRWIGSNYFGPRPNNFESKDSGLEENYTSDGKTADQQIEGGENMDLGERRMRPGDAVDTVFAPLEQVGRRNYDDDDSRYQDVLSQTGDEAEAYRVLGASDVLEQDLANGDPVVNPEQAGMFVALSPYGDLAVDEKIDQYLDEQGMEDIAEYVEGEMIENADHAWDMMAQLGLDQAQIRELSTKVDSAVDALETVTRTVYAFPDSDDVEAVIDGVQDARQEGREAEEHYDDFVEDAVDRFL